MQETGNEMPGACTPLMQGSPHTVQVLSGERRYREAEESGEDKLKVGTRICIDTEDDGWVEGEIIVIKPLPLKRGEKMNRRKYVIKTSETHESPGLTINT